ncbi:MAG: hypothetical protein EOP93_01520, partial [Lysobacteraceae bacterium]
MPDTPAAPLRNSLPLVALVTVLVAFIVVGPFLMVRKEQRGTTEARALVNHGYEVEATVQALMYDLRN